MSGFPIRLQELFQTVSMCLAPLISCVVLLGAVLLLSSDRRSHTVCMVIGATISMVLSFVSSVLWFPDLGIFARGDLESSELQRLALYLSAATLIGRILFAYGLLMLGIVRLKLSRNPDFRRESL